MAPPPYLPPPPFSSSFLCFCHFISFRSQFYPYPLSDLVFSNLSISILLSSALLLFLWLLNDLFAIPNYRRTLSLHYSAIGLGCYYLSQDEASYLHLTLLHPPSPWLHGMKAKPPIGFHFHCNNNKQVAAGSGGGVERKWKILYVRTWTFEWAWDFVKSSNISSSVSAPSFVFCF